MPKRRQIVESKPVCHIKCNADGNVVWHKVQLVAQGFSQITGIDYTNTFAPVVTLWNSKEVRYGGRCAFRSEGTWLQLVSCASLNSLSLIYG